MATSKTSGIPPGAIAATASFLGPLTTTFSAPSTCNTGNTYSLGQDLTAVVWQVGPTNSADGCMPSKWVVNGYYSPAICPYGYTDACFMTQSNIGTTICCPTNLDFSCYPGVAYNKFGCVYSTLTMALTSLLIDYGHTTTGTYSDVTVTGQPIWAFSVQVHKAASPIATSIPIATSDMSALLIDTPTSDPATNTNLDTTPDTTSMVQTASASPSTASTSAVTPVGALAGGAIAGIVAGIFGALALGIVGTFLFMRRRKTQDVSNPHPDLKHSPPGQKYLREDEITIHELDVEEKEIPELDEQRRPSEMPSGATQKFRRSDKQMIWELPA
ncbi:hypothetical protein F5B19DRAFT_71768 [Rostrohypoxylon terebratum]|nr:hypothetical protein F5B19DRAFT_71768 [Rostrohypoxylon terebratum]